MSTSGRPKPRSSPTPEWFAKPSCTHAWHRHSPRQACSMVGLDSEARSCPTFPALSAPDGAVTAFVRERMLSWHQSRSSLCLGIGRQRKPVPGAVGAQRYPTMSLFAVWTVSQHGARSAPGCFHGRFPATTQRDPDPVTHWTDTALIFGLLSSGDYRLHRFRPFGPRPTRTWLLHLILFFSLPSRVTKLSLHETSRGRATPSLTPSLPQPPCHCFRHIRRKKKRALRQA